MRSVTPQAAGQTRSGATPALRSTYYHLVGGRARPAPPPRAVKTDLARAFRVEVVYAGSGGESINYKQGYGSVCAGRAGSPTPETDTVSPMSWSVRYVVDLDDLLSAVRGPRGTTLVPSGQLRRRRLRRDRHRDRQPLGLRTSAATAGRRRSTARRHSRPAGPDPGGQLSFPAGSGPRGGGPDGARASAGPADPDDFTLGPSLWDSGATTAIAGPLALLGGTLPDRPYAPVKVSWPASSAQAAQGFAASPCQGDAAVCTDAFQWHGTVSLQPVPGA